MMYIAEHTPSAVFQPSLVRKCGLCFSIKSIYSSITKPAHCYPKSTKPNLPAKKSLPKNCSPL